jgi:hypothetical protein
MGPKTIFEKTDRYVHRRLGNTFIAVPLGKETAEINYIINYNETADAFFSRVDGKTSLEQIAAALAAAYEVPAAQALGDLQEFAQDLVKEKIIREKH